jgi:hypothetical protein
MSDPSGLTGLIMASAGAIVGGGGLWLSKRGQRDDAVQTQAAHTLAERVQKSHEMESLVDRLAAELERADRMLAEERTEFDRRSNEQANRCRAQLMSAMDTVHTLQGIVRDEIAVEAARTANDAALGHIAEDHPDTDPPEVRAEPFGP